MAIVYIHRKADTDEIFYVGVGINKYRSSSKNSRNLFWKRIVSNHSYYVEIILDDISKEEAFDAEKFLILKFGRRDNNTGILCNLTNGGEGTYGIVKEFPTHLREVVRQRMIGNKYLLGHKHSDETKEKLSKALKGRPCSEYSKQVCSITNKGNKYCVGRKHTKEELSKMRNKDSLLGKKNIAIYLNIRTGIFYTVKDLAELLDTSKYIIRHSLNHEDFILTN